MIFSAIIPIRPSPKERPLVLKLGRTVTRKKTLQATNDLKKFYLCQYQGVPISDPCHLDLKFVYARPKSWPKKRDQFWHISTPDIDNLAKLVMDSMNKIIVKDDSVICKLSCEKFYGERDEIRVKLRSM